MAYHGKHRAKDVELLYYHVVYGRLYATSKPIVSVRKPSRTWDQIKADLRGSDW